MASAHISQSHRSGVCCWRILPLILAVLCSIGIPAIWLLMKRTYVVTGAIKVDSIIPNILTGTADRGDISDYQSFIYTQARMVTSPQVVRSVADDLADKGLRFFPDRTNTLAVRLGRKLGRKKTKPDPEAVLKEAILDGIITAEPLRKGEFIEVIMKWHDPEDAKRIVDAFIRNYMAIEVTSDIREEERDLTLLEDEQKLLAGKMGNCTAQIAQMASEYGSKKLAGRYDMKLMRLSNLLKTLTEVEARRIYLQARVKVVDPNGQEAVSPQERVSKREKYVNRDAVVIALANNVVALEEEFIEDVRKSTPSDAETKQKGELLEALRKRLDEQKKKARETFDTMLKDQTASLSDKRLIALKAELDQTRAHESELRDLLAKEDEQTIGLGQKELAIQDLQDELGFTKEMYDRISRRIAELRMERKRPSRISIAYTADIEEIRDIRGYCTVALAIGFVVFGILWFLLRRRGQELPVEPQQADTGKGDGL